MSLVDFPPATGRPLGALVHGELAGILEPLSHADRRDLVDMLDLIARHLAVRTDDIRQFRSRLDAVIASLNSVVEVASKEGATA